MGKKEEFVKATIEFLNELVKMNDNEIKETLTLIKNACGNTEYVKKYTDALYDATMNMKGE